MVTAVPVIGPLLAVAVIGSQAAAQTATESAYRAYDQAEETAADRYAVDLLNPLQAGPAVTRSPRCWRASTARGPDRRGATG